MTLVVNFACEGIVVQVSDRLVCRQDGQCLRPYNDLATKQVIYRAKDAIVAIGYAGLAYLCGVPTDQWIVQTITGQAISLTERRGIALGGANNLWDIGYAVRKLSQELNRQLPPGHVVQLLVSGYQVRRQRLVRPVVYRVEARHNKPPQFVQTAAWRKGTAVIEGIGVGLTNNERAHLAHVLRSARPPLPPRQIAQLLTATLRKKSHPGVGPHGSAVIIPPPGQAPVQSLFLPLEPHYAVLRRPSGEHPIMVEHHPWVVGPGMLKPPTVAVGSFTCGVGGIEVELVGHEDAKRRFGMMSTLAPVPWQP